MRHLKHWFLPHKHNDHRPHLIRAHGLAVLAMLILGVQASAYAIALSSAPTPLVHGGNVLSYATGSITPVDLLNLTNQQRAANGLPALRLDSRLNSSAGLKAQDMFANDYWNHVSPACVQPWHWFTVAGYNYSYAGENLAKDFDTSAGVMDGWMNSPGHRANVLNPNYTDVGFSVQNGTLAYDSNPSSGSGSYTTPSCTAPIAQFDEPTTLVVAHYGSSPSSPAVSTPAPTSKPPAQVVAAPVATPVPTPTPAPTATPGPSPSVSPSTRSTPAVQGQVSPAAPVAKAYGPLNPLSLGKTLSWNTKATIGLLALLLLVYLVTHLTVWRKGLKRWSTTHYRLYAAAQVSSLTIAISLLATSGFGKVG